MRAVAWPAFLTLVLSLLPALPARADPQNGAMEFESYQLILLRRRPDAPKLSDADSEALQKKHLQHLTKMAEAGKMVAAGPFEKQDDESLRGLCLYHVATLEEARKLAEQDPAVVAGRLRVEAMTWWTQKGSLMFPVSEALVRKLGESKPPDAGPGNGKSGDAKPGDAKVPEPKANAEPIDAKHK